MKKLIIAGLASFLALPAFAATIDNREAEEVTVTITEDGVRTSVAVPSGTIIDICPNGCFMSFPSGDILALKGDEAVVYQDGRGTIQGR